MSKKVLLVEDNAKNRSILKDILQYKNYTVLEADTGKAGLDIAKNDKPDLILMDLQMPVMDGFTALKELRKDAAIKDIKVIAVTSSAMEGDRQRVLEHGFDNYISKPFELSELLEMVKNVLGE